MKSRVCVKIPGFRGKFKLPGLRLISIFLAVLTLFSLYGANLTTTATEEVFYDFISAAKLASWSSSAGSLQFPGSESDSSGFACYKDNSILEDGNTYTRVLETHPEWADGGWIMGIYPQINVPDDAELAITFGFLQGAAGSDGASFQVLFQESQARQTLFSHSASYDGKLDSATVTLEELSGKTGRFILYVNAGKSSGQDWACWAEAKITIKPSAPPQTTTTAPTTTQTVPTTTQPPKTTTQTPPTTTKTVPPTTQLPPPTTTTSAPITTTQAPPITTKPVATEPLKITSGPLVSDITPNSAVISWQTNAAADSSARWSSRSANLDHNTSDSQLTTLHTIKLENLASATNYRFQISSTDSTGSSIVSKVLYFTTGTDNDDQKPHVSLNLPDTLAGNLIIKANADDNQQVERVVFFLDGLSCFTDYSFPFEWQCDTSDLDDGDHSFGARAYDQSGNYSEEIRNGELDRYFDQLLSPMKVDIVSPENGDEICGAVFFNVLFSNDLGFRLKSYVLRFDGEVRTEYHAARESWYDLLPKHSTFGFDYGTFSPGEHVIQVQGEDEYGNWGSDSVRINVVNPPELSVERQVSRIDNFFQVTLAFHNSGEARAENITVTDKSSGYQCAEGIYMLSRDSGYYGWISTGEVINDAETFWQSSMRFTLAGIEAGETTSIRYRLVPILVDPLEMASHMMIGSRLVLEYTSEVSDAARYSTTSTHFIGWNDSTERSAAFAAADYLMLTCPANLFNQFAARDVNSLLASSALLAEYKQAAFGYVSPERVMEGSWSIRELLISTSPWSRRLCPGWAEGAGYLLIIGEMNVIPAFDIPGLHQVDEEGVVHDTDYPYADTCSENHMPELVVGRIIGETAIDMQTAIKSSIGFHTGEFNFSRHNADALIVSGPEFDEGFADISLYAGSVIAGQGGNVEYVLGEYFIDERELLREALVMRGDYTCMGEPGHILWDGTACTGSHPPADLAILRTMLTTAQALDIHHDHGYPLPYTIFDTICEAGDARGEDVKEKAFGKDLILWIGHGGSGGWAWVLDDFLGDCGSTNLYVGGPDDPSVMVMDFGNTRPVVLGASCLTGAYARQSGVSIARAFLRLGAGVYIGNVEVMGLGAVEELATGFFRDNWTSSAISAGDALKDLKYHWARCRYSRRSWDIYEMNLYGDPRFGTG